MELLAPSDQLVELKNFKSPEPDLIVLASKAGNNRVERKGSKSWKRYSTQ